MDCFLDEEFQDVEAFHLELVQPQLEPLGQLELPRREWRIERLQAEQMEFVQLLVEQHQCRQRLSSWILEWEQ
jgi:hypothetical protein